MSAFAGKVAKMKDDGEKSEKKAKKLAAEVAKEEVVDSAKSLLKKKEKREASEGPSSRGKEASSKPAADGKPAKERGSSVGASAKAAGGAGSDRKEGKASSSSSAGKDGKKEKKRVAADSEEEEEEEEEFFSEMDSGEEETETAAAAAAGGAGASAEAGITSRPPSFSSKSFKELGVCEPLCEAIEAIGWKAPSRIQAETLPVALSGKDIIGLAETGSGKTGAFAIPVLQSLLESPQRMYALVLAPTRELAFQISEQFEALGSTIGLRTAVVVGGVDMMTQAIALARKPHIVIGTPGRIVDHLENTKGFSLRTIKYLILDEADRMLSLDFEEAINNILASLPRERHTYLFSATMTSKVAKLQRASLRDPVRVEVSDKYGTVSTLVQQYLFVPAKYKEAYLAYLLNEFAGQSGIIFVSTCSAAQRTTLMLQNLGFGATCLHGQMSQAKRLGALNKFKAGSKNLLIATDVASRGLDIPTVDLVVNYDVPSNGKDYIHRVGRTARAGRSGRAVTFVTQYDIELYQRIEHLLGKKLEAFPAAEEAALLLVSRVAEALRLAALEMREGGGEGGGRFSGSKRRAGAGDAEEAAEGNEDAAAAALLADSHKKRRMMGKSISSAGHRAAGGGGGGGGGHRRH